MADVTITVQSVTSTGLTATYSTMNATDSYYVDNSGSMFLHVINVGANPSTFTFDITQTVSGLSYVDPTVQVSTGTTPANEAFIGPFASVYEVSDASTNDGRVKFTQSKSTGVTVAALRA